MGFWDWLHDHNRRERENPPKARDRRFDTTVLHPPGESTSNSSSPKQRIVLPGNELSPIYTYHGKPLKHLKMGDEFELTVSTAPQIIKSDLSYGMEWNTSSDGYALLYGGKVIGASARLDRLIRDITKHGYEVVLQAKKTGWYEKNIIPEIEVFWPDYADIEIWWDIQQAFDDEIPIDWEMGRFNFTANGESIGRRKNNIPITFQLLDPKPGSKAKPKIGASYRDKLLFTTTARSMSYKYLSEAMDSEYFAVANRMDSMQDDGQYYRVSFCWKKD